MVQLNPDSTIDRIIAFWQTEDLLRAHQFNVDEIVKQHAKDPKQQAEVSSWMQSFADQMRDEDILQKGHVSDSLKLIEVFEKTHENCLVHDPDYKSEFEEFEPVLKKYQDSLGENMSPARSLFEVFYAFYLKSLDSDSMNEQFKEIGQISGGLINKMAAHIDGQAN